MMEDLLIDILRYIVDDISMYHGLVLTHKWKNGFINEYYWRTRFGFKLECFNIPECAWEGIEEAVRTVWRENLNSYERQSCNIPRINYIVANIDKYMSIFAEDNHICIEYKLKLMQIEIKYSTTVDTVHMCYTGTPTNDDNGYIDWFHGTVKWRYLHAACFDDDEMPSIIQKLGISHWIIAIKKGINIEPITFDALTA